MIKASDKKNVIAVVLTNISTILVNVLTCLFLPKIMNIDDYSLYRTFLLYSSYSGLLSFGLIHGIYIKYGSLNFDALPEEHFRYYNRLLIIITILSYIFLSAILFISKSHLSYKQYITFVFIAFNIPIINIRCYFSSINQFTKNFTKDAVLLISHYCLTLLMIISMAVFSKTTYIYTLIISTAIIIFSSTLSLCQNRTLVFGKYTIPSKANIFFLFKKGIAFMVSEHIGLLILNVDCIFVNIFYSSTDFAMYSFSATLISGIYMIVSIISNLIYPYLSRIDSKKYLKYYNISSNILCIVTVLLLSSFYIIKMFIEHFLPLYKNCISILSILYCTIIFRSLLLLVSCNFFKVLKCSRAYTTINSIALLLCSCLDLFICLSSSHITYIAFSSLCTFIIWYVISETVLCYKLKNSIKYTWKRYLFIILSIVIFLFYLKFKPMFAFILYVLSIALIIFILYRKMLIQILNKTNTHI